MNKQIYYYIDIKYSEKSRYERELEFTDSDIASKVFDLLLTSETYYSAYSMRLLKTTITDTTVRINIVKEEHNAAYFA